jgi:hypothetical protein
MVPAVRDASLRQSLYIACICFPGIMHTMCVYMHNVYMPQNVYETSTDIMYCFYFFIY